MPRYFALSSVVAAAYVGLSISEASAADLTQAQAITIAKAATTKECPDATPCTYFARREAGRWLVQVQFTKRNSPTEPALPYPGGHEVLVLDEHGKILQTLPGE